MAELKPRESMTTEQLAEKVLQDVKEMPPDEKAHVRAKLNREFFPESESPRDKIVRMMARYGFTPAMCADKSSDTLLGIAAMTTAHRRYLGAPDPDDIIRLGEIEDMAAEVKRLN
jgi:hypothetical protein